MTPRARIPLPTLAGILVLGLCLPSFADPFQVTRVITGDRLKVENAGSKRIVRLAGIDAPKTPDSENEAGQPFNRQATSHLMALVQNRTVEIRSYGVDESGRLVAEVFVRDRNVNIEMVRAGLAEVHSRESVRGLDLDRYLEAEREARAARRGMWSLEDRYVSPKDWRQLQGS